MIQPYMYCMQWNLDKKIQNSKCHQSAPHCYKGATGGGAIAAGTIADAVAHSGAPEGATAG
jgi:hypothetical protein